MRLIFLSALTFALSLTQHTSVAQSGNTANGNAENHSAVASPDIIVINFNASASKERILLNWTIDKNEGVDQIEVERSRDEKNFIMAGLVFGTEQTAKADYLFYEKNKGIKFFYRLRIINKDRTITYSSIVSPEPATTAKL